MAGPQESPAAGVGNSKLGVASLVLASFAVVTMAAVVTFAALLTRLWASRDIPPDVPGLGGMLLLISAVALLSNLAALGLGVAGILQRRRKKLLAFLGVVASVAVFVAVSAQDVMCLPVDCVPFT